MTIRSFMIAAFAVIRSSTNLFGTEYVGEPLDEKDWPYRYTLIVEHSTRSIEIEKRLSSGTWSLLGKARIETVLPGRVVFTLEQKGDTHSFGKWYLTLPRMDADQFTADLAGDIFDSRTVRLGFHLKPKEPNKRPEPMAALRTATAHL